MRLNQNQNTPKVAIIQPKAIMGMPMIKGERKKPMMPSKIPITIYLLNPRGIRFQKVIG